MSSELHFFIDMIGLLLVPVLGYLLYDTLRELDNTRRALSIMQTHLRKQITIDLIDSSAYRP